MMFVCRHAFVCRRSYVPAFFRLVVLLLGSLLFSKLQAAELLIFERPGCSYCAAFDREVASVYPLTAEGKAVPSRRVDITKPIPADLAFVKVERLTPVFVLVDNGHEIGRFRGYSGDEHFWGMFGVLIEQLKTLTPPAVGPTDGMKAGLLPAEPVQR